MELICRKALLAEYDRLHEGAPGKARELIVQAPTVEPKRGRWIERRVFYVPDSDICEMQTAKCSVCELYHTTPYQYSFTDYNFCPHCGAQMERSGTDEAD